MKKLLCAIALPLLLLVVYSCGKVDNYPFICDDPWQELPAGDSATLHMPTAFTPNGDGLNDRLGPTLQHIVTIDFTVYDAAQTIVFKTTELNQSWQAPKPGEMDVYHYRIKARTKAGNEISRCGTVYALTCIPRYSFRSGFIFSDQLDPAMPEGYIRSGSAEVLPDCN